MKKRRTVTLLALAAPVLLVVAGVAGWKYHEQPRFCSDMCHIMGPYFESWQASNYEANVHAAAGVTCLDCHKPTLQEQVNELIVHVKGDFQNPLRQLEVPNEFCFDCHIANEHMTREAIIERTQDYSIYGEEVNPHAVILDPTKPIDPHNNPHDEPGVSEDQLECFRCHRMHRTSPGSTYCNRCHHEHNFNSCTTSECHEVGIEG